MLTVIILISYKIAEYLNKLAWDFDSRRKYNPFSPNTN